MNEALSAIVVDDELMARNLLKGMLAEVTPQVEVRATCANLPEAVKAIRRHKPKLVFLDIEMPGHSGLELLDFFDEHEIDFNVIFTTAYSEYAIKAFKLSAIDYLLKPIAPDQLELAVARFQKQLEKQQLKVLRENLKADLPQRIAINSLTNTRFIAIDDIALIKASGAYAEVMLTTETTPIVASKGLRYFEDLLSPFPQFYRSHKSYLVNLKHVSEYIKQDGGYLKVQSHEIAVSSERLPELLKLLNARS